MSIDTKPGDGLLARLWTTKGCRFAARERLLRTNWLSITSISALSVYVIGISVTLLAFGPELHDTNAKWLNVISIGMAVLIIAFSLIEFSRDHLGNADKINQSALKIGELYGLLTAKMDVGKVAIEDLQAIEAQYAAILSDSKLNHSHADYQLFMLVNYRDYPLWWTANPGIRTLAHLTLLVRNYWVYVIAITAFPLLAIIFGSQLLTLAR